MLQRLCLWILLLGVSFTYVSAATFPVAVNYCGNNIIEPEYGEQCDDGNGITGDGCNVVCEKEYGLQSEIIPECRDGIDNDLDGLDDENDPGCFGSEDDDEWHSLGNEYYVAPNGDDTALGGFTTPFSSVQKAFDTAVAGDTIFLRSGVYAESFVDELGRSMITKLPNEGSENMPISLKNYAGEQAILDGSIPLTWTSCIGNALCAGYANQENLYVITLDEAIEIGDIKMVDQIGVVPMTRDILAKDEFYSDNLSNGYLVPVGGNYTRTTLQDVQVFTHPDSNYYEGAQVWINTCNNNFFRKDIVSYDPTTHTVTFDSPIGCDEKFLTENKDRYIIANLRDTLRQGEFYFDRENNSIFYASNSNPGNTIRMVETEYGIMLNSRNNIMIDGIDFKNFSIDSVSARIGNGRRGSNLMVKKSDFLNAGSFRISTYDDISITRNTLIQNDRFLMTTGDNIDISYNYVTRGANSGIGAYTLTNSNINNNTVENLSSHHGNAITGGYIGNDGLTVEYNTVRNANIPLTFGGSRNMVYRYNLFELPKDRTTGSKSAIQGWNHTKVKDLTQENILIENNTFIGRIGISSNYTNVDIKNNIFLNTSIHETSLPEVGLSHNLYLGTDVNNNQIGENDVLEIDRSKIFVDHANFDYRLVPNISLGTDTKTIFAASMSDNGSYVGALPIKRCDGALPIPIITLNTSDLYVGDTLDADAYKSTICGNATSLVNYTWKLNGTIVASSENSDNLITTSQVGGINILSVELEDNLGNIGSTSVEVFVQESSVPGQMLYISGNDSPLDSSGREYHGEWQDGEASYIEGVNGNALYFHEDTNTNVKIAHNSDLTDQGSLSISFWAKREDITRKEKIFDAYNGYYIGFNGSDMRYFMKGDGKKVNPNNGFIEVEGVNTDTDWHHYVMTYDGTTVKVYIDSNLISESTDMTVGNVITAKRGLQIGYNRFGKYPSFYGSVDEFRMFSQALSPAQIEFYGDMSFAPIEAEDEIEEGISLSAAPEKTTGGGGGGSQDQSTSQNNKNTAVPIKFEYTPVQEALEVPLIAQVQNKDQKTKNSAKVYYTQKKRYKESCSTVSGIQGEGSNLLDTGKALFFDENTSLYPKKLRKMASLGIIKGYDDGGFYPKRFVSRIEFLKILLKTHCFEYSLQDVSQNTYSDIDVNTWPAKVVLRAQEMGVISGDMDTSGKAVFRPNAKITKIEALKILVNLSEIQIDDLLDTGYNDISVSWQEKYVRVAESLGLYDSIHDKGSFSPNSYVSREDMVDLIDRLILLYK